MYSYIALALAEEKAMDMRCAAARSRYRKQARAARGAQGWPVRQAEVTRVPDSYEDFLCQTAGTAAREPAAAGRSAGQAGH